MSKIYLDMDGVLADFDGGLLDRRFVINREDNRLFKQHVDKSQWSDLEKKNESLVHNFMSEKGFFRNLRMIPGADRLWAAAGKPIILTARPKVEDVNQRVANEKREWIEEHFGQISDDRFICCLRSEKSFYATTELGRYTGNPLPNILVDDLEWNCSEWNKAGGIGIHFKDMDQAVRSLKLVTV